MEILFVVDKLEDIEKKISLLDSFGADIKFFVNSKHVAKLVKNKYILERIVAIYHHYRKEAKTANSTPQVIVQQQQQADPLEQLEKLSKLKEMGVISEEEFNTKKADLLAKL